jgi:hypothetical protein
MGFVKKEERKTVSCLNVRRGGIPRKLRDRVNGRVILQHYPSQAPEVEGGTGGGCRFRT